MWFDCQSVWRQYSSASPSPPTPSPSHNLQLPLPLLVTLSVHYDTHVCNRVVHAYALYVYVGIQKHLNASNVTKLCIIPRVARIVCTILAVAWMLKSLITTVCMCSMVLHYFVSYTDVLCEPGLPLHPLHHAHTDAQFCQGVRLL